MDNTVYCNNTGEYNYSKIIPVGTQVMIKSGQFNGVIGTISGTTTKKTENYQTMFNTTNTLKSTGYEERRFYSISIATGETVVLDASQFDIYYGGGVFHN